MSASLMNSSLASSPLSSTFCSAGLRPPSVFLSLSISLFSFLYVNMFLSVFHSSLLFSLFFFLLLFSFFLCAYPLYVFHYVCLSVCIRFVSFHSRFLSLLFLSFSPPLSALCPGTLRRCWHQCSTDGKLNE